jgi:hypothetical protein
MSYESKLYVVVKSPHIESEYPRFCWQIAQYDIAWFPPIADLFREDSPKSRFTDCGLVLSDRDNQITEDMYGDKLREADLETVINVLRNSEDQYKDHQRLPPLLAMLESFYVTWIDHKDMVVIHFGY